MPNIYSFLQTAYHFVKSLVVSVTKKMYRTAAVLFTGLTVVTVVSFNSSSFAGAGKTAAALITRTMMRKKNCRDMMQSEEESTSFGTDMEVLLTASKEQGQRLIGSLLEKNIQDEVCEICTGDRGNRERGPDADTAGCGRSSGERTRGARAPEERTGCNQIFGRRLQGPAENCSGRGGNL